MFAFTIVAFVAIGVLVLISYIVSKPSLKEIREESKRESSHTSDVPFNKDFPIVEEVKPKMSAPKKSTKKKTQSKK